MPNRLRRYYGAGYSHFITTSCYHRHPLLGTPQNRDLFLAVLEQVRAQAPQWLQQQRYAQDVLRHIVSHRRSLTPEMRDMATFVGMPY